MNIPRLKQRSRIGVLCSLCQTDAEAKERQGNNPLTSTGEHARLEKSGMIEGKIERLTKLNNSTIQQTSRIDFPGHDGLCFMDFTENAQHVTVAG